MAGIYGHKFTSSYGADPHGIGGDTWSAGLADLTGLQIGTGLQACRNAHDPWPPSLPEFRAMCFGIPSFAAVKLDIRKQTRERTPFTRMTWEFLDGYQFGRVDQDKADRLLREAYAQAVQYVMTGGELPEEVQYLEQAAKQPPQRADTEHVRQTMAEIDRTLRNAPDHSLKRDPLPPAADLDIGECGFGDAL